MPTKKVVKKEKTIQDEAQEVLDATLHNMKVQTAARLLTELSNLERTYQDKKKRLEEQLAEVDKMKIDSYGCGTVNVNANATGGVIGW